MEPMLNPPPDDKSASAMAVVQVHDIVRSGAGEVGTYIGK